MPKNNTANTDSLSDWFYNPKIAGPTVQERKDKSSVLVNVLAFIITAILVAGITFLWFGMFAVLIHAVFGVSLLKAFEAAALYHIALYAAAVFRNSSTK